MSKRKNVRKRTKEWIEYTTDKTKAAKVGKKPIKRLLRIVVSYFMFIRLLCSLCCLFAQRLQFTHSFTLIPFHSCTLPHWFANGIQSSYIELHILNILQNGWRAAYETKPKVHIMWKTVNRIEATHTQTQTEYIHCENGWSGKSFLYAHRWI